MRRSPFSASCGWFGPDIMQMSDTKMSSAGPSAYQLPFAVEMVSSNLWLPFKQCSFHPRTQLSVSAFSRSL
jgi:hypothetical protein